MPEQVIEVTDANFEAEVGGANTPVLLDFSAAWCGPCKQLAPIVADIARQYAGRLKVGHVDVEAAPATAARFGVMSVPTLIFMKGGKPANQIAGALKRAELEREIQRVLG